MRFKRLSLEACAEASGAVVVVDVIRAFTVAAYAFAAGARDITLVDTVEEALRLRERIPNSLALGEVSGLRPEGFDLGNSPSELANLDLSGRHLIQRTSAGTQGAVRCSERADHLLASSLCCASATALHVKKLAPTTLTFIITGISAGSAENDGDEDMACADYIEALLLSEPLDTAPIIHRVRDSYVARTLFNSTMPGFPVSDIEYCVDVDRFDFAMRIRRENGLLVMKPAQ